MIDDTGSSVEINLKTSERDLSRRGAGKIDVGRVAIH